MKDAERMKQKGTRRYGVTSSLPNIAGLSALLLLFVGLHFSVEAAVAAPKQNSSDMISQNQSVRRTQFCPDDCPLFAANIPWVSSDPNDEQVCQFEQCKDCDQCPPGDDETDPPASSPSPSAIIEFPQDNDNDDETDAPSPSPSMGVDTEITGFSTGSPTPSIQDIDNNGVTDAPSQSPSETASDSEGMETDSLSPTPLTQDNVNDGVTDAPSLSPSVGVSNQNEEKCNVDRCNEFNTVGGMPWKSFDPNEEGVCDKLVCQGCPECDEVTGTDTPTVSPTGSPTFFGGGGDNGMKCEDSCYDYSSEGVSWKSPDPNGGGICDLDFCEDCPECDEDDGSGVPENTNTDACNSDCGNLVGIPWTDPDPNAQQICAYSGCTGCPLCNESDTETDTPTASPTPASQMYGGGVTETDAPVQSYTPPPAPVPYYKPTPTGPTYDETHPYKPPDDDILNTKDDEGTTDQLGERQPETPEEMLHDRNVEILAGVIGGLAVVLWLLTAHQVMENPDGLCAGICRLCVKCVCLIFKIVCLPCRFICGCGSNKARRGHVPASTIDDSNMRYDLELA
eukprot:CAMPEP_0185724924 /NCGR_PEP_ID=MMETSP1171-20130828/1274_1 /TAXON_ID=374046 /ORGANISM="Helicotheca tamensis, Strain CCMP826" /LENGTH=564 /DNA_ID=CAMNT_0028392895 /DNA_START=92 /DNA_END=1786 /DNA_ORIENTATION=-